MEVALYVLGLRAGLELPTLLRAERTVARQPFDPRLLRSAALAAGALHVKGAPERVLEQCALDAYERERALQAAHAMAERGLRVACRGPRSRSAPGSDATMRATCGCSAWLACSTRHGTEAAAAVEACRRAQIKIAMVTGDHPGNRAGGCPAGRARRSGRDRPQWI